ncbi:hypothetical protein [Vreelandella massiliensis]|uniref:hypothetical protein n=1 Tax=Vreelandella massiliensis TaxID=1816686 RepID=UPI00096A3B3D|nr:hypothetical protein [Halomonas massiliensis]
MKSLKKRWKALKLGGAKAPPLHVPPKTLLEVSKDLRKIGLGGLFAGAGGIFAVGGGLVSAITAILLLLAGALVWVGAIVLDAAARHADEVAKKES